MHNKSIRGTSFTLPSMKKLKKQLGEMDAFTQYIEVALRYIEKGFHESEISYTQYIKDIATKLGVHLHHIDTENYKQKIILRHLIIPRAFFESFVEDLQEDIRGMGYPTFKIGKNVSTALPNTELNRLIYYINTDLHVTIDLTDFQKDLFDYYRILRNAVAHSSIDPTKIKDAYAALNLGAIHGFYPTLSAPNKIEDLTFDDFTLCTANIKNIADIIVGSLESAMRWDSPEVLANPCFANVKQKAKVKSKERILGYIKHCALITWNATPSDADCEKIYSSLV